MPFGLHLFTRCCACLAAFVALASTSLADSTGTGFFVNSYWVMTNDHVVEACSRIEAEGFGPAKDVLRDPESDLALIRMERPFNGHALPFRTGRPRLAENLHVLGYPLTGLLSPSVRVTTGSLSALDAFEPGDGLIQVSATIQPGNSGGPVIDDHGAVVGVAVGYLDRSTAQNVNFAISGEVARDFLERRAISFETVRIEGRLNEDLPDVIERAANATALIRCSGATRPATEGRAARSSRELVISRGRDVIGYDYQFIRNVTAPGCMAACESDPRCLAFTFNLRHGACFLKDNGTLLVNNADAISGYAERLARDILDTGFTVSADTDSPGGDYKRIRAHSFLGCLTDCALDARCRGFAYVHQNRDCWLKDRIGRIRRLPGVEFGVR